MKRRVIAVAAILFGALATTSDAQPNAPTAAIASGKIRGVISDNQAVFLGIPFAAPPVGQLRWREPQPVAAWTGTRDARTFGHPCMQPNRQNSSEDCLTLNVWSPEWPAKSPKAVMVWFHGGGNTEGWTNTPFFFGSDLAKHGVVVVTVQYRLGVFGFFANPELTKESPHHASGNYGLLDQVAALHWIHDNIAAFGGDPNNVTIFGESAGAEDVGLLLVSPLSNGLFHRAIAESGPLRRIYPSLEDQERNCGALALQLNAPATNQLSSLRALDAATVLTTAWADQQTCRPVNLDGYVLTEQPLKSYAEGKQHKVPFILGNTLREGFLRMPPATLRESIRLQYRTLAPFVLAAYGLDGTQAPPPDPVYGDAVVQYGTDQTHRCRVQLTGLQHAATGQPFYQFQFSRDMPGKANETTHTDEIPFVFGKPSLDVMGIKGVAEQRLSDQIESYWTNFAKTGDPNGPGLPHWGAFDGKAMAYISFVAQGATAGQGLRREQCDLFLQNEKAHPTWRRESTQ